MELTPAPVAMMRAGAEGYLLKDEDPVAIVSGLRAVAQGQMWLSGSMREAFAEEMQRRNLSLWQSPEELLTERELEILALMAQGFSNAELAERLVIAEGTVRNHVSSIYGKLGASSRAEAVAWAWQHGIAIK